MSKKDKIQNKVEVCEEPEIQFLILNPDLTKEIEVWLRDRGGQPKKNKRGEIVDPKIDSCIYLDSEDLDLLNEGCEYRIKEKGKKFRHDLKTPHNTEDRMVVRDENDIVWRLEFKFEDKKPKPRLTPYFGQALLGPVAERSRHRFFDMDLMPQFRAPFFKSKFDIDVDIEDDEEGARVEYSFQEGHIETMSGSRRTRHLKILELERRDGDVEGLLLERAAVKAEFERKGLMLLPKRKLLMGFELLLPDMTSAQRSVYERVLDRMEGTARPFMRERRAMAAELLA